jgi:hypothetical protein
VKHHGLRNERVWNQEDDQEASKEDNKEGACKEEIRGFVD